MIERATLLAWPARERAERFGWVFNASEGFSRRINAIWPLSWTGEAPLDDAIGFAEAWARERGVTPSFKLSEGLVAPPELQARLRDRGYTPLAPTIAMAAPLGARELSSSRVALARDPDVAFLAPMRADAKSDGEYAERSSALHRTPTPRAFATLRADGAPVAMGACVLVGAVASIFAMRTQRGAQRRGYARETLSTLLAWAQGAGATVAALQVGRATPPALALYASEGFTPLYAYAHWRAPA